MISIEHRLSASVSDADPLALVNELNQNDLVEGILVQLPLPAPINPEKVLLAFDPAKDVDGFHPVNVGKLAVGARGLVPCTPRGCMALIKQACLNLEGLHTVVVGRSNIVGKPLVQLLLQEQLYIDRRPFQDRRSPGHVPAGRYSRCCCRTPGDGARRVDQTGCNRDRCRDQPDRHSGGWIAACR